MNNKQKAGRWSEAPGRQQRKVLEQGQAGEDGEAVISRVSDPLMRACWDSSTPAPC